MIIFGASTLGEMAIAVARRAGIELEGVYDDLTKENYFCGVPVLGGLSELLAGGKNRQIFVAVGDNKSREKIALMLIDSGLRLGSIIDPRSLTESDTHLGEGCLLMAGCYLGVGVTIGAGSLVFPGVSITHHNKVGDFNFFAPNSSVGGFTKIGDRCKIGMNAVILPYGELASDSVVLPGAVYGKN